MAGVSQAPSPWWGQPGQAPQPGKEPQGPPPGYSYDKVKQSYVKTPGQVGAEAGQAITGLYKNLPGFNGMPDWSAMNSWSTSGYGGQTPNWEYGGGSNGASATPQNVNFDFQMPSFNPGQVQHVAAPDNRGANAAAFARSKDQVGQINRSAMTGLRSGLGATGGLGGGNESRGITNIVQSGAENLGNVSREQAIKDSEQAAQFAQMGYQGDIAQRGQDIGNAQGMNDLALRAAQAKFQGGIEQRGQNIGLMNANRGFNLEGRGQDLSARGQDLENARANRAFQFQAQGQSQQDRISQMMQMLNGLKY